MGPRYREVVPRGGTRRPLIATSRGAACGDVDGDGGVDVLVINRDGAPYLLLNRAPSRGNWLRIQVEDRAGGPALGALVTARLGARRLRRQALSASSYQSANDPAVHLGLAQAAAIDQLEVLWPTGGRECFGRAEANRTVVVRPGEGVACEAPG